MAQCLDVRDVRAAAEAEQAKRHPQRHPQRTCQKVRKITVLIKMNFIKGLYGCGTKGRWLGCRVVSVVATRLGTRAPTHLENLLTPYVE